MPPFPDKRDTLERHGLAIISPYGGVWADKVFETAEQATAYLKREFPEANYSDFKLAQAILTVKVIRPVGDPYYIPIS